MSADDLLYEPIPPPPKPSAETRMFTVGDVFELGGATWLVCSIRSFTHIVVWGDVPPVCAALNPIFIPPNKTYKWKWHATDAEMAQFKRMGAPL